jgi:hypothetical protein
VDSLFQVLKTNDKFMEVLHIGKRKIIYTNVGKDDMANNKRQLLARNIELVLYLKCLLQFFNHLKKKLSLNQTIESYFPSVENAAKITIGNLLNHRSGIYNFTSAPDYDSYSPAEN